MNLDHEGMDIDRNFVSVVDAAKKQQTAILSGRYEILHPGHIITIRREARRFKTLYVFVVDNPANPYPSAWTKELMEYATADFPNVAIILDPRHFGKIKREDLSDIVAKTIGRRYDVFLSANPEVSAHLRSLGVVVEDIPRTEGYSGSELKERFNERNGTSAAA
jgi:glycerol-3-phosphate cytidylyltransferase-like family protein